MKPSTFLFYAGLAFIAGALIQLVYLIINGHLELRYTLFVFLDIIVGVVAIYLREWVKN